MSTLSKVNDENNRIFQVMESIEYYFLCFMIYSFGGWIYELVLCLIHGEGFVNRGFNLGPYLPIYGFGGVLILVIFYRFKDRLNPAAICLLIAAFAAAVELSATYIMDLCGTDWSSLWDYSERFLNFQGRIALWPALKFGLMGILFIYLVQPYINKIFSGKSRSQHILAGILFVVFLTDCVYHIVNGSNFAG